MLTKSSPYINIVYDHDVNNWFRSREFTMKHLAEREWVAGWYQWNGIEYRGEGETSWPRICSMTGAVDLYLQKKDAYFQNLPY